MQKGASELFQESQVINPEMTNIIDVVFEHGDSFYAHSESEAAPHFRIDIDSSQNIRIDHAATEQL